MAKLTKAEVRILKQAITSMLHLECVTHRIKAKCMYLPSHYLDKPVEYYEGMRDAQYQVIECTLHATNNYQGYGEWKFTGQANIETPYRKYFGNQLHEIYKSVFAEEYPNQENNG